jgi:gas vesicle protein
MENKNDLSKKLILGLIIGGIVGAGALYCIQAGKNRKTPVLKKLGKTISGVGEMLENCNLENASDVIENIESKMPEGIDIINSLSDWVDSGMTLWKKFKGG